MGACESSDSAGAEAERVRDGKVQAMLRKDKEKESVILKLLLLGAGGSGKSTVLKQMKRIYGEGYSKSELEAYTPLVHNNIIRSIQELIYQAQTLQEKKGEKYSIQKENQADCDYLLDLDTNLDSFCVIDQKLAAIITKVWADPAIKATFEARHLFYVQESAKYFFEKVNVIADPDYIPSVEDFIRIRTPTTGVNKTSFSINGNLFKLFDMGGQRSERKKWIHCFENVSCVIFVASLSSYNETLYEDNKTNRLVEALNLFDEICNQKWFRKSGFALFLNKSDLFQEKYRTIPITECPALLNFKGDPMDYRQTTSFIKKKFEVLNRTDKSIYTHVTCATDKSQLEVVFNTVKENILKLCLETAIPGWAGP